MAVKKTKKQAKRRQFKNIKRGGFFNYEGEYFIKDSDYCPVQLTGEMKGQIDASDILNDTLVTPVKVKIVEVK